MPTIFDISTVVKQTPLTLVLEHRDDQDSSPVNNIKFILSIEANGVSNRIEATVNLNTNLISLKLSSINNPKSHCFLACAGKALIKPLIECFNTDIQQYLICLRQKGLFIVTDIVNCIIECLDS